MEGTRAQRKPLQGLKDWLRAFDYSSADYVFDRMASSASDIEDLTQRVAALEESHRTLKEVQHEEAV